MLKLNLRVAALGAALIVGLLALGAFATPAPPPPQQPPPRPLPELILQAVNELRPLAHVVTDTGDPHEAQTFFDVFAAALPDLDSNALAPFVMASTPVPLVVSLPAQSGVQLLMFNPKEYLKSGSWDGGAVFLGEQAGRTAVGTMKWQEPLSPQLPAGLYGVAAIYDPQGTLTKTQGDFNLYLILIGIQQDTPGVPRYGQFAAIIGLDRAWVSEYQAVLAKVNPDDEIQFGVGVWLNLMAIEIAHEGI